MNPNKKINLKIISIVILSVFVCCFCGDIKDQTQITGAQDHVMTIFVHGTILPAPSFTALKNTFKGNKKQRHLYSNEKKNRSFYQKYLDNLRTIGIYSCQPITDDWGLFKIDLDKTDKKTKCTSLIAQTYKQIYQEHNTNKKESFSFYTFGWDGKLSARHRVRWANRFYEQLQQEIAAIKKNIKPKNLIINILAHSHGGNVVLNLAAAEEKFKQNLSIDNVVLLGTPIQVETQKFVNSPVFKNIYNLYSQGDTLQIIDKVSTKGPTLRRFEADEQESFTLPKNLTQIEIQIGKLQPAHNELWGWGDKENFMYRKKLLLNPFPVSVFVPAIINLIKTQKRQTQDLLLKIDKNKDLLNFALIENQNFKKPNSETKLIQPINLALNVNSMKTRLAF